MTPEELREKVARAICAAEYGVDDVHVSKDAVVELDYLQADAAINVVLEEAAEEVKQHKGQYCSAGYMSDRWACSCGWESDPFFDGAEYARAEFDKHRLATILSLKQKD